MKQILEHHDSYNFKKSKQNVGENVKEILSVVLKTQRNKEREREREKKRKVKMKRNEEKIPK